MCSVKNQETKPSPQVRNCTSATGNLRSINLQDLFLLFRQVVYEKYKVEAYSHNKCFLVGLQKGSWVIQNILHTSSGLTVSLIYQSVLSSELLNTLQNDASLNSLAQHSHCPTDLPVGKHSLFSFGSLLPVRQPTITLNNSSSSAHVSSQVPGSYIPLGRLYIVCS